MYQNNKITFSLFDLKCSLYLKQLINIYDPKKINKHETSSQLGTEDVDYIHKVGDIQPRQSRGISLYVELITTKG